MGLRAQVNVINIIFGHYLFGHICIPADLPHYGSIIPIGDKLHTWALSRSNKGNVRIGFSGETNTSKIVVRTKMIVITLSWHGNT